MYPGCVANVTPVDPLMPVPMEELHSLDPRRQELLEARFTGAVTGNTAGSTGSTSGGAKVTVTSRGGGARDANETKVFCRLLFSQCSSKNKIGEL